MKLTSKWALIELELFLQPPNDMIRVMAKLPGVVVPVIHLRDLIFAGNDMR